MKFLLRTSALYGLALAAMPYLFSGAHIKGGIPTYALAGVVLALMSLILRPILGILTLPLNLLTFGAFSFLTNTIILYLLTVFIPQIQIVAFTSSKISVAGFVIPEVSFNTFFAYVVCASALSLIIGFLTWFLD